MSDGPNVPATIDWDRLRRGHRDVALPLALSYKELEIGRWLGVTRRTVRGRLEDLRGELRSQL